MILVLQAVLSVLAGWGVFVLWRRIASTSTFVFWFVTVGLLIRAIGGQLAFWISYLSLPIARSAQLGDGLWSFAIDARQYLDLAETLASEGPDAIIHVLKINASVFYTQTLATAMLLVGASAATALLLNITAFLGCCRIALYFGDPRKHKAVVVAIAALSLAPSAILWSLQPLKDILFLFLVGLFFAAARWWQQLWIEGRQLRALVTVALLAALAMAATLYGVSGIRWYFGLLLVFAMIPFLVLAAFRASRHLAAAVGAIVLVPLLSAAFYFGAGPSVPFWMIDAVAKRDLAHPMAVPSYAIEAMNSWRAGFEASGGATTIGAGKAVKRMDASLGAAERQVTVAESTATPPPGSVTHSGHRRRSKLKPPPRQKPPEVQTATATAPPANVTSGGTFASQLPSAITATTPPAPKLAAHADATTASAAPPHAKTATAVSSTPVKTTTSVVPQPPTQQTTSDAQHPRTAQADKAEKPVGTISADQAATRKSSNTDTTQKADANSAKPSNTSSDVTPTRVSSNAETTTPRQRRHHTANPKSEESPAAPVVKPAEPLPAPAPAVTSVKSVAPPQRQSVPAREAVEGGANAGTVSLPAAPVSRLLVGSAALALPRFLAQRLGILEVRGGHGLWLVIELDTLVFDAILIFTFISLVQAVRRRNMNMPVFWMLLIVTVGIGGALAYTVTNFGTLFRHRDMVLLGLILLPLATLAASREPLAPEPERVSAAPVPAEP